MDILYIFIWIPDIKTQTIVAGQKLHKFYFGGSNYCLNFTWRVQLLPALLCVESGALFTPENAAQNKRADTYVWRVSIGREQI